MSASDNDDKSWEAGFFNLETKIQYKDRHGQNFETSIVLEKYMMNLTVDEVKLGLLSLRAFDFVKHDADSLGLYLVLPVDDLPANLDLTESESLKEMEGHQQFKIYAQEFARCHMLRLVARG